MTWVLAAVIGALVGAAMRRYRLGGATVAKPALRLCGVGPLLTMTATVPALCALSGGTALRGWRSARDHRQVMLAGAAPGVLAGVLGAVLSSYVPGDGHLQNAAAGATIALSSSQWRPRRQVSLVIQGATETSPPSYGAIAGMGVLAGASTGLIGVGGGILVAPRLLRRGLYDPQTATEVTAVIVTASAVAVTISYSLLGMVDWVVAGCLLTGAATGYSVAVGLPSGITERGADRFALLLTVAGCGLALAELLVLAVA